MTICDNCGVNHDEFTACGEQDVEDLMYERHRDDLIERHDAFLASEGADHLFEGHGE